MNGADRLRQRCWLFAGCVFDEANWTLVVEGRRVGIEAKPLELLRELLLAGGKLVTKEELLDRIWPEVHVVEASLTTAIHKLRQALGDDRGKRRIIETVPGLGYRLNVPATSEYARFTAETGSALPLATAPADDGPAPAAAPASGPTPRPLPDAHFAEAFAGERGSPVGSWFPAIALAMTVAAAAAVYALGFPSQATQQVQRPALSQRDAANALRKLDVGTIDKMLAAGWNPNTPFDNQGNGAINFVLNMCEWDRDHDQSQMLLMVRTLIDGGAEIARRNVWGDTPYSIAKAQRYCGPNHPVTRSIRAMCYAGYKSPGDRCLASYELTADQRREQGVPARLP